MYTIVGLGNPGEEYTYTRHNAGWLVLQRFMDKHQFPKTVDSRQYSGMISEGMIEKEDVLVLFPMTFMNKSGSAVVKVVRKEDAAKLIVVYDDAALPLGDIRISFGRGSGGHNGIESIIASLGTKDFVRIRVGVAGKNLFGTVKRPTGDRMVKHVLGVFKKGELATLEEVGETVSKAVETIICEGAEKAMNTYN